MNGIQDQFNDGFTHILVDKDKNYQVPAPNDARASEYFDLTLVGYEEVLSLAWNGQDQARLVFVASRLKTRRQVIRRNRYYTHIPI